MRCTISVVSVFLMFFCNPLSAQNEGPGKWEETISSLELRDEKSFPKEGAILFTGSSSIAMWNDISKYFPEKEILNRGFGGSEFSDLIHYADRVIYPYKPSKVFIYEGDNDLAAGEPIDNIVKEAIKLREEIAAELPGTSVIFISPKPSISRWNLKEKYQDLNKKLRDYAGGTEQTFFADVWTPMLNVNGEVREDLFLEDGLHMNSKGYEIWQRVLAPYLEEQ